MFRVGILTVSDKGHAGERLDTAGPELARLLDSRCFKVAAAEIVPDEPEIAFGLCDLGLGFPELRIIGLARVGLRHGLGAELDMDRLIPPRLARAQPGEPARRARVRTSEPESRTRIFRDLLPNKDAQLRRQAACGRLEAFRDGDIGHRAVQSQRPSIVFEK